MLRIFKLLIILIMLSGCAKNNFVNDKQIEKSSDLLGLDHNYCTGKNVRIAIIDDNLPEKSRSGVSNYYDISKKNDDTVSHGFVMLKILRKIAPNVKIDFYSVGNKKSEIERKFFLKALEKVVKSDVKILNLSLNFDSKINSAEELLKIANKNGIITINSSGNDGLKRAKFPSGLSEVISVSSVDKNGFFDENSNYGEQIMFSLPNRTEWSGNLEGTSISAIQLTGIVARLIEQYGIYKKNEVVNMLIQLTGNKIKSQLYGYGIPRLNKSSRDC
ncbi:S8 family peptidase [Bacillus zhangzhouensis]|uniref:S8 family peptidase n=1 Tax=Bacillus zhangzhouensis TaxID=1178540 RepID=UPI002813D3E6|nr:S8/S53 family peptidase [Bacillus zhangzhouensis]MDR0125428.1 S8/S53 family peptidase [Bacillus zhangzhouensis]